MAPLLPKIEERGKEKIKIETFWNTEGALEVFYIKWPWSVCLVPLDMTLVSRSVELNKNALFPSAMKKDYWDVVKCWWEQSKYNKTTHLKKTTGRWLI